MEHRIHDAFNQVRASDELKERTRSAVIARMRSEYDAAGRPVLSCARRPARRPARRARAIALAACAMLLALAFGAWQLYFTPVAAIAIDVNPSVELAVNRFDIVVDARSFNAEGARLLEAVDVRFSRYTDAVDGLLDSDAVQQLVDAGEQVALTVACPDQERSSALYDGLEGCAAGRRGTSCHQAAEGAWEAAHHHGVSVGRWEAYAQLEELGVDVSADEVNAMTMRELRQLLVQHGGDAGAHGERSEHAGGAGAHAHGAAGGAHGSAGRRNAEGMLQE